MALLPAQVTVEIWIGLGIVVGMLAAVMVAIALIGCLLPRSHRVGRTLVLRHSPQTVWETITDYANVPSWQRNVSKVERLPDRNGHEVWRETYKGNYSIQLETTRAEPPVSGSGKLVRTIADEKGPFSGQWEFDLQPQAEGCRLTITEFGEVPNPFFRFMFRLFMNPAVYLEIYLQALADKFNEPATIETV